LLSAFFLLYILYKDGMQPGSHTAAEPEDPFERIFEGLWHHGVLVLGL
jgi:hypothetical protein